MEPDELTKEEECLQDLDIFISTLRENRPKDKSKKDWVYSVAITEAQKLFGFFKTFAVEGE